MTPGARIAAAIAILDNIQTGAPAEQALTRWGRTSRYAGSKDRAAVRDLVFDTLRCKRSAAAHGGGTDGRALMIGQMRQTGQPIAELFSGEGHAPAPLTAAELAHSPCAIEQGVLWNLQDWLLPEFERSLGDAAEATALALQNRAPVTLRVNLARSDVPQAQASLRADGVDTQANPLSPTALTVLDNPRKVRTSEAYNSGLVELQDAASQAVIDTLPPGGRVLDYCAGGGGKTLALAADRSRRVSAHDAFPARMKDLPFRAERAGVHVEILPQETVEEQAPFDLVLCDVPCSGSGAWRRSPDAKWSLTPGGLSELHATQDDILHQAAEITAPSGLLAYATCSVLASENEDRVTAFVAAHPDWTCTLQKRFDVSGTADGFFIAHLTRV